MRVDRSILAVGAVIGVALLVAGVAIAATPAGAAAEESGNRTIQVSASEQLSAEANQAVVTVGVVRRADDATTARKQVARNVSQVRSALESDGIADSQIETVSYRIGEARDDRLAEYRAGHLLRINVSDVEAAGTVIDTAVASGANEIDDVRFGLDDASRDRLEERALEQAVATAREKARTIGGEANLSVTGVRHVTTSNVGYQPSRERVYLTSADGAGGAATSIEGGPVSVSAQVTVVFEAAA